MCQIVCQTNERLACNDQQRTKLVRGSSDQMAFSSWVFTTSAVFIRLVLCRNNVPYSCLDMAAMDKQKQAPRSTWITLAVAVFAYIGYVVIPIAYCHYNGRQAVATVTNTSVKMEGGTGTDPPHSVQYYTLTFDGHDVQKRSSGRRKIGDRLPVIYLPDNPHSVVRGSRPDGLWETIKSSTNEHNLTIAVGVAIFLLFCAARPAKPNHSVLS